jgi:hypothetical protein
MYRTLLSFEFKALTAQQLRVRVEKELDFSLEPNHQMQVNCWSLHHASCLGLELAQKQTGK